jgi:hypothetical protein
MVKEVVAPSDRVLETTAVTYEVAVSTRLPDSLQTGLVLVAGDVEKRKTMVRIVDRTGRIIHQWRPFWSEIWSDDPGNFPERPNAGMYLHGVEVLPDGSLVANFEHQSTFRLNLCGEVMWKLANLGHHSVHYADDKTLWVPAENYIASGKTGFPNHRPPLRSWTLQNISLDGKILRTIPVIEILLKNGLEGLLYISSPDLFVSGDTLHLNDVETFPADLKSEIFKPGDLLISLLSINAVMVLDPETLRIKFISIGQFTRQHDPDFLSGDRISVFDNRTFTLAPGAGPPTSRIVEVDVRSGAVTSVLDGSAETRFFTAIMGKHQRLRNGNILIVSSGEGRVLEFTPNGRLVWHYDNRVDKGLNMRIYDAKILPPHLDEAFFQQRKATCQISAQQ